MHLSLSRNVSRLPKRFPVGTTYVVEGHGGEDGHLRVFSRYVVLPDGQRINLGADTAHVPEKWPPIFRKGHAPNQEPAAAPASRARRTRIRQAASTGAQNGARTAAKRAAARTKKISANGGTPRRHRR
jgi:hypothetical protein